MTPTTEAPATQSDEEVVPTAEPESEEPVGDEGQPAAAAELEQEPTEDPQVKELRDRLADQGRKNAAAERLAFQQSQQIANLSAQIGQLTQYASQQIDATEQARFQAMEPEQQIAYLGNQLLQLKRQPAPRVEAPAPAAPSDMQVRMQAHLDEIKETLGVDVAPEEIGLHPDETSWVKAAWKQAVAKGATEVPAKKVEDKKPTPAATPANIQEMVRQEVARVSGVGRPNAANPTGVTKGGATIADLNKMASDPNLSPRARAQKMREAQVAAG